MRVSYWRLDTAGQLIGELLQRGVSVVDKVAVYNLKVQLHVVKGLYPQAVDTALTCLNLFGVNFPAHPSSDQVQAEYETVWRNLNGRSMYARSACLLRPVQTSGICWPIRLRCREFF